MAIEDSIPAGVIKLEEERKSDRKLQCRYYGCDEKGHRTRASKRCKYHAYLSVDEIKKAEDRFSHNTGRNNVKHNQGDHMHTIALTYI